MFGMAHHDVKDCRLGEVPSPPVVGFRSGIRTVHVQERFLEPRSQTRGALWHRLRGLRSGLSLHGGKGHRHRVKL